MKTYIFTVEIRGEGDTEEEAWEDAVEAFFHDPGEPHDTAEEDKEDDRQLKLPFV